MFIPPAAPDQLLYSLRQNDLLWECLQRISALDLPSWYIGAGCVAQTIWNAAHLKPATADIADYDIVYFDSNLSAAAENEVASRVSALLSDLSVRADVKNQARVHLWYKSHFGYMIRAYTSCEDALASWPTTATAVGVRLVGRALRVHAPFGMCDLFSLTVRPNRAQITPAIYDAKVARWTTVWPRLRIMSWSQGVGSPGSRWII